MILWRKKVKYTPKALIPEILRLSRSGLARDSAFLVHSYVAWTLLISGGPMRGTE